MNYAADLARSVVRYDPAQRDELRTFQVDQFGAASRQADDRAFAWLYEDNPHRGAAGPCVWLCKRDGVVVGQQGAIPVVLKVGAEECRALWGIDLMVHPAWRLKGVGPALSSAYQHDTDLCLGLGLSDASQAVFRRQGWTDMGKLTVFVRPLDPEACAQASQAPGVIKAIPQVLLAGSATLFGHLAGFVSSTSLDPISAFDERVDGIWRAASPDFPVLVKRDFAAISWRFDQAPSAGYYQRFYLLHRNAAVGYAVVRFHRYRGYPVASLIDYLAGRRWLPSLFALTIAELRARGATAVFVEHLHARSQTLLKAMACWPVTRSTHFMLRASGEHRSATKTLGDSGSWFMTLADSDCDHQPREGQEEPGTSAASSSQPQVVPPAAN